MSELQTDETGGILHLLPFAYSLTKLIPLRKSFSNADEQLLRVYGNWKIGKMTVCRAPIQSFLNTGLNLLTMGKWEKAVKKFGYDKLFHLYLTMDLIPPVFRGKTVTVVLEKNETPRLYKMVAPPARGTECKPVQQAFNGTLNDLLKTTQAQMGDDFWRYNSFTNNCQTQILNVLGANNLLTIPLQNFIKQDVESIAQELPDFSKSIIHGITDTARRGRTLIGMGLQVPQTRDKSTISI